MPQLWRCERHGSKSSGEEVPMDTTEKDDQPIEDQIVKAEGLVKALKGLPQTPGIKPLLEEAECKLKSFKNQQKRAGRC